VSTWYVGITSVITSILNKSSNWKIANTALFLNSLGGISWLISRSSWVLKN